MPHHDTRAASTSVHVVPDASSVPVASRSSSAPVILDDSRVHTDASRSSKCV